MTATITTLTSLRDQIAVILDEVAGLTIYPTGDVILSALPAVEMKLPRISRVPVDDAERELGTVSWTTEWPMSLLVDADSVSASNDAALQFLALIVAKFDAKETLDSVGFNVLARLIRAEELRNPPAGVSKPTTGYDLTLEVLQLV